MCAQLEDIMAKLDEEKTGSLDYDDFVRLLSDLLFGEEVYIPIRRGGMKDHVIATKQVLNVADVHTDKRSNYHIVDKYTGHSTQSLLVAPVMHRNKTDVLGIIEMINKQAEDGSGVVQPFTGEDEKMIRLLASHAAAFITHVGDSDD